MRKCGKCWLKEFYVGRGKSWVCISPKGSANLTTNRLQSGISAASLRSTPYSYLYSIEWRRPSFMWSMGTCHPIMGSIGAEHWRSWGSRRKWVDGKCRKARRTEHGERMSSYRAVTCITTRDMAGNSTRRRACFLPSRDSGFSPIILPRTDWKFTTGFYTSTLDLSEFLPLGEILF